jgi:hypothetical protein
MSDLPKNWIIAVLTPIKKKRLGLVAAMGNPEKTISHALFVCRNQHSCHRPPPNNP